jgi:Major Facilitator Superfamily
MRVSTRSRPIPTATEASATIPHATTPPASRDAVACRNAATGTQALRVRKTPRRVHRGPAPATIWQNHNFVLLVGGQIVSLAGTGASQLAFPLLVLWLTHSPGQVAVDEALYVLPYAVLCLPAGALVDHWDRKRVMIVCDIARATLLLSIPLAAALGCLTIWQIYGLALVQGTLFCFFDLAATASLLRIASREHLATASSTYTAAINGAQCLGLPLAAFSTVSGALYHLWPTRSRMRSLLFPCSGYRSPSRRSELRRSTNRCVRRSLMV